jgi:hypothetical protein
VFEKRVLKKMFGPKREEVTGERSRLQFEEVHQSTNIIRAIK